ncbi:MAG: NotI family restriction endonuclease [Candidatus Marinimicrobia bacterium]|nr:NotI family restriction endonuclease [Candidatus Neomarinimicrobiota bacterium]
MKNDKKEEDMKKGAQPLAEVFGHILSDITKDADRYRSRRLCPFNNKVPNCTKDKAENPLGVCSVIHDDALVITCPIRFRENWLITDDAASFFFADGIAWSSLTEVRLNDANGKSAGSIDVVLVAYDDKGKVIDFGALEIQAVYISGNVREPFEYYMKNPKSRFQMDWSDQPNYPRPDYLSSSRKRLAPQLLFKGGILHSWQKKTAVALNKSFFDTLPPLTRIEKSKADIAWLIYDLELTKNQTHYELCLQDIYYTERPVSTTGAEIGNPGSLDMFLLQLHGKLYEVAV